MDRKFFPAMAGIAFILAGNAMAQRPVSHAVTHVEFDSPEGWAMQYFSSVTSMSGLQPPVTSVEERRVGSVTVGLEADWLPALSAARQKVGFAGRKDLDLNQAPVFMRPSVRVGLPWKLTLVAAGPPPLEVFGVRPSLFAYGVERPIWQNDQWRFGWRGYGQIGSVRGAFTCPASAVGNLASASSPASVCIAESKDVASLTSWGTELQLAYRPPRMPKLSPHVAFGGNYLDNKFQVDAPLAARQDRSRLWSRGKTVDITWGASYLLNKRMAFTVDAYYSPLWVHRSATSPVAIDGLFNVRAMISYTLW